MQFDIEELKIYTWVMQDFYIAQWVKLMEVELDQIHKNEMWVLISASKMKIGH